MNKEKLQMIENMEFKFIDPIEISSHEKRNHCVAEYNNADI
jgi:hypothetical protein